MPLKWQTVGIRFLNVDGGFYIAIKDPHGVTSDELVTLTVKQRKLGTFDFFFDDPVWGWTDHVRLDEEGMQAEEPFMTNGSRTSIIRIRDKGVPRSATPARNDDGVATNMAGRVIPTETSVRGGGKVGTS